MVNEMSRRLRRRRRRPKLQSLMVKRLVGRGISRPYVDKRNRLMLGSGSRQKTSKQTGGFFPLAAALTAAPAVLDLLGKVIR